MMGSTTFSAHNFQFSRSNEGLTLPCLFAESTSVGYELCQAAHPSSSYEGYITNAVGARCEDRFLVIDHHGLDFGTAYRPIPLVTISFSDLLGPFDEPVARLFP